MDEKLDIHNHEHYPDPTAYEAIKRADGSPDEEYERHRKLIGAIFRLCELADYHVEDRIIVKDMRTGKIWR